MSLMKEIKSFDVPRGEVGVWWLGQNGFVFKTPEGTLVSVDLYLTNSVPELCPIFLSICNACCLSSSLPKSLRPISMPALIATSITPIR